MKKFHIIILFLISLSIVKFDCGNTGGPSNNCNNTVTINSMIPENVSNQNDLISLSISYSVCNSCDFHLVVWLINNESNDPIHDPAQCEVCNKYIGSYIGEGTFSTLFIPEIDFQYNPITECSRITQPDHWNNKYYLMSVGATDANLTYWSYPVTEFPIGEMKFQIKYYYCGNNIVLPNSPHTWDDISSIFLQYCNTLIMGIGPNANGTPIC